MTRGSENIKIRIVQFRCLAFSIPSLPFICLLSFSLFFFLHNKLVPVLVIDLFLRRNIRIRDETLCKVLPSNTMLYNRKNLTKRQIRNTTKKKQYKSLNYKKTQTHFGSTKVLVSRYLIKRHLKIFSLLRKQTADPPKKKPKPKARLF